MGLGPGGKRKRKSTDFRSKQVHDTTAALAGTVTCRRTHTLLNVGPRDVPWTCHAVLDGDGCEGGCPREPTLLDFPCFHCKFCDVNVCPTCHNHFDARGSDPWSRQNEIRLVVRGSKEALVFEHGAKLRAGDSAPLTLTSHPGMAMRPLYNYVKQDQFRVDLKYIEMGVGAATDAPAVRYEGGKFLSLDVATVEMTLDVAYAGKITLDNPVTCIRYNQGEISKEENNSLGQHFTIGEDNTLSPTATPRMVVGSSVARSLPNPNVQPVPTLHPAAFGVPTREGSFVCFVVPTAATDIEAGLEDDKAKFNNQPKHVEKCNKDAVDAFERARIVGKHMASRKEVLVRVGLFFFVFIPAVFLLLFMYHVLSGSD